MDLAERVERVIRKYGMLAEGEQVLAAFSGGADSVCMAAALHRLGYCVHAVHVHHGLRPQEADRDAAFCEEWCRSRKIPFRLSECTWSSRVGGLKTLRGKRAMRR